MTNRSVEEQIEAVEEYMMSRMSKEALERYGRVKALHMDAALYAMLGAMREIKQGKYRMLVDARLKTLLLDAQEQLRR